MFPFYVDGLNFLRKRVFVNIITDDVWHVFTDYGDLHLELWGPAVAFKWISCQIERDPVPLVAFQEPLVPEVDLLDLVEGEVDGQVRLQEVQVVDWNKFWIIGPQQIVAYVEKFQGEEV